MWNQSIIPAFNQEKALVGAFSVIVQLRRYRVQFNKHLLTILQYSLYVRIRILGVDVCLFIIGLCCAVSWGLNPINVSYLVIMMTMLLLLLFSSELLSAIAEIKQHFGNVTSHVAIITNANTNTGTLQWQYWGWYYLISTRISTISTLYLWVLQVVQEYERAVIFRLGRLLSGGSKGPGNNSMQRGSFKLQTHQDRIHPISYHKMYIECNCVKSVAQSILI